jgi:hypothetical protein
MEDFRAQNSSQVEAILVPHPSACNHTWTGVLSSPFEVFFPKNKNQILLFEIGLSSAKTLADLERAGPKS